MAEDVEKSKYLPLYYSYIEQLNLLQPDQIGQLIMALLRHGRDGTEPDFARDSSLYMAFSFIMDNSNRAEERGRELREMRRESGRKGGLETAKKAQRNERGEFVAQDEPGKTQAKSKQTQASKQIQAYNNNNKVNNDSNNDDDNNRQTARGRAGEDDRDDVLSEREQDILDYCASVIGEPLKPEEKRMVLDAAAGMSFDSIMDAISIAYERQAHTVKYVVDTIHTQRIKPNRMPDYT